MESNVHRHIQELFETIEQLNHTTPSKHIEGALNVADILKTLAQQCLKKTKADQHNIQYILTRFEVTKKLYLSYDQYTHKAIHQELLSTNYLKLFTWILVAQLAYPENALSLTVETKFKYLNAILKLQDFLGQDAISLELDQLFAPLMGSVQNARVAAKNPVTNPAIGNLSTSQSLREIPLDVLFYENPIARAYLHQLHSMGLKPRRIIHLVSAKDIVTKKTVGSWLPISIRKVYAANLQQKKIGYWTQKLFKSYSNDCHLLFECLQKHWGVDFSLHEAIARPKSLKDYSNNIETLMVDNLRDPVLQKYLEQHENRLFLYTGGGIVPAEIFNIPNIRILHIHPGYLPDIRGADGLLWSTLLNGQASATCFFMNAGIDTGDIIYPAWMPHLPLPKSLASMDHKMLYRLLYSFVDPALRACVLRDTIFATDYLLNINSQQQTETVGTTFHFMHEKMKNYIYQAYIGRE